MPAFIRNFLSPPLVSVTRDSYEGGASRRAPTCTSSRGPFREIEFVKFVSELNWWTILRPSCE
jgi:hypothetical protein